MSTLSPVNDFAKYFKLERTLNHHLGERDIILKEMTRGTRVHYGALLLLNLAFATVGLMLLYHYGDVTLYNISSSIFYPFNFMVQSPHLTYSQWFGSGKVRKEIPVSLFNLILLSLGSLKVHLMSRNWMKKSVWCEVKDVPVCVCMVNCFYNWKQRSYYASIRITLIFCISYLFSYLINYFILRYYLITYFMIYDLDSIILVATLYTYILHTVPILMLFLFSSFYLTILNSSIYYDLK